MEVEFQYTFLSLEIYKVSGQLYVPSAFTPGIPPHTEYKADCLQCSKQRNGAVRRQEGGLVIKIRRTNCSRLPNDRAQKPRVA